MQLADRTPAGVEPVAERASASEPTIDVIGKRNWYFLVSLLVIVPGMISMITQGFLLGIDFQGGTEFFLKFANHPTTAQVEQALNAEHLTGTVQQTADGGYIIRTGVLDPIGQRTVENHLAQRLGEIDQGSRLVNSVGPTVAGEIVRNALLAVVAASVLILAYVSFRFRNVQGGWRAGLQFGGSAILALLHDVFLLTGVYSILGMVFHQRIGQIDSLFLTAVLTVVGFSVHDTIVVFDRIRENLVHVRGATFDQVVNLSILQTAARSIITSFTVVIVLTALLLFGGEVLRGFILALLIGIVSGTYSSIFNASQLLVVWRKLQPIA